MGYNETAAQTYNRAVQKKKNLKNKEELTETGQSNTGSKTYDLTLWSYWLSRDCKKKTPNKKNISFNFMLFVIKSALYLERWNIFLTKCQQPLIDYVPKDVFQTSTVYMLVVK